MGQKHRKSLALIGEIDEEALETFVEEFQEADSTPGLITLHIYSPGGSVEAGTAMYELIRTSKNAVRTIGFGDVSSMAVLVLAAGDHRVVTQGTRFLLHDGACSITGSLLKTKKHMDEHLRGHDWYAEQLAERTKTPISIWKRRLDDELYLGAKEALDWKLVDEIQPYRLLKKINKKVA